MIDLTTSYMGLKLKNPLVVSASPLGQDLNALCRLEEAGAAAVVLHSLFEEQIRLEGEGLDRVLDQGTESFPEARPTSRTWPTTTWGRRAIWSTSARRR